MDTDKDTDTETLPPVDRDPRTGFVNRLISW